VRSDSWKVRAGTEDQLPPPKEEACLACPRCHDMNDENEEGVQACFAARQLFASANSLVFGSGFTGSTVHCKNTFSRPDTSTTLSRSQQLRFRVERLLRASAFSFKPFSNTCRQHQYCNLPGQYPPSSRPIASCSHTGPTATPRSTQRPSSTAMRSCQPAWPVRRRREKVESSGSGSQTNALI
jgi:hypothetical protein